MLCFIPKRQLYSKHCPKMQFAHYDSVLVSTYFLGHEEEFETQQWSPITWEWVKHKTRFGYIISGKNHFSFPSKNLAKFCLTMVKQYHVGKVGSIQIKQGHEENIWCKIEYIFVKSHMDCNVQYSCYNSSFWFNSQKTSETEISIRHEMSSMQLNTLCL